MWTSDRHFDIYRTMMVASDAVVSLGALAQQSRLSIFRMLVQAGEEGLDAGTIALQLAVPPSSLSFHLAHLSRSGLVLQQRQGRRQVYRVDYAAMIGLVDYLTENFCGGQACGPSAISSATGSERSVA